ncbi:glycolate oxidase subunit GlcE [Thiolinea disciformis]|uniref:glycolate oxidase subunit GlcE n=1 Tax=Thiolinea disciformis TaxID=125614 RepID=UPI00037C342A|nr:glycolate oxidase subunit GlcE [Thiolinea disciformis]
MEHDHSQRLQEQVLAAYKLGKPLAIQGGNSKAWYGNEPQGEILSIAEHHGIINYEPTELVITARAGTRLSVIETLLAEHNQCLAFEPPHFGETATLGGTIACNFSGPARPYLGSARDFVLGCQILNGKGEILNFGGQVMKNVAGYDVSRLMAGALGTLGALLTISLHVLPKPEAELTLVKNVDAAGAIQQANAHARLPLPISASAYVDGLTYIRLSGTEGSVKQAAAYLGGEPLANGELFWHKLREQQLRFFQTDQNLWRLSLPADTPVLDLAGTTLYDWGGAQRWLLSDSEATPIRDAVSQAGGHTTLFRAQPSIRRHNAAFQPLSEAMLRYHRQLKQAFDPKGIFNPNRLYAGL